MKSSKVAYSSFALIFILAAPFACSAAEETGRPPLLGKTIISDEPWAPPNNLEPKVVYGDDDRLDIYEVTDPLQRELSGSVCALVNVSQLTPISGGFELRTSAYRIGGTSACADEPFGTQPTAAFCTGFLVGDDLIVTAGHCYSRSDLAAARFVFGFTMTDSNTPVTTFSENQVYRGVEIVARKLESNQGEDYAVVRLDRPVTMPGAEPLEIRRTGAVGIDTPVGVIGHPSGLPLKVAFGSDTLVRENSASNAFFMANLDTYGGNSGSPIFNAATGVVEGILVRGLQDFVFSGCFTSNVVPNTSAEAEESNKMDELAFFVPPLTGGEGEGEGEGESPLDFCEDFAQIKIEYQKFLLDFGVTSADMDSDGLAEELALKLIQLSACGIGYGGILPPAPQLFGPTETAFDLNLAAIRDDPFADELSDYENALAALFIISQDEQTALFEVLDAAGITLIDRYEAVVCLTDSCFPWNKNEQSRNGFDTYEVLETGAKGSFEPFSGEGDYDSDGTNNITEVGNVRARGGQWEEELRAVTDMNRDGTEFTLPISCAGGPGKSEALWFADFMAIIVVSLALFTFGRRRQRTLTRRNF